MVTVSFESFSSHLFLCYCLYHIAFFNENTGAIVTWSCFKNQITNFKKTLFDVWNKILRAKSPNSNGLSLQIAITGRPLARKVQSQCKTECSMILYAGSCSVCFSWRCLFGCKRPRSENSWRWTEAGEGRLKASKHDLLIYWHLFAF